MRAGRCVARVVVAFAAPNRCPHALAPSQHWEQQAERLRRLASSGTGEQEALAEQAG